MPVACIPFSTSLCEIAFKSLCSLSAEVPPKVHIVAQFSFGLVKVIVEVKSVNKVKQKLLVGCDIEAVLFEGDNIAHFGPNKDRFPRKSVS